MRAVETASEDDTKYAYVGSLLSRRRPTLCPISREFICQAQRWLGLLRFLCAILLCLCLSCSRTSRPGQDDLPPGVAHIPGIFVDVGPRWSHDGQQIAFLRYTADRRTQLCLASGDLTHVEPLLEPELVSPDRVYRTGRAGYCAPQGLTWSPRDRVIVLSRVEWFTFEDGERLAGTSLWAYDVKTRQTYPLAVHPEDYESAFFFYRSPRWSPDGKRLAFIGEGLEGETALFVHTLEGSPPEIERGRYDRYTDVDWPAWSPDGKQLAFRQGILRALTADSVETVRVIEPGGMRAERVLTLTPGRARSLLAPMASGERNGFDRNRFSPRVASLAWSPDGTCLAFSLTPAPLDHKQYSVWVLEIGNNRPPRRISPMGDMRGYLAPIWIDSQTIGALRTAESGYVAVALSLKGLPPRDLCRVPSDDLDWSPDRKRIVCATAPTKGKPAAPTTLRVISTGL